MQTITTTELRTKSKQLVETLNQGKKVKLIHRSKIIGEINPKEQVNPFNAEKFLKIAKNMNLPKLTDKQREQRYREAMEKKHGKGISRH